MQTPWLLVGLRRNSQAGYSAHVRVCFSVPVIKRSYQPSPGERVYLAYTSRSQSLVEGSQDRHSSRSCGGTLVSSLG